MAKESQKVRSAVKRNQAESYLLISLVAFAVTVIGVRVFLEATGYPQIGNSVLHIAHAIWGGLLLFVAVLLPLLLGAPDTGSGRGAAKRKAVTTTREPADDVGEQHFDDWRSRLMDSFHGRRFAARKRIAEQGPEVLPLLDRLIRDQDARVRRGAAAALAELGGEEALALLASALARETERSVRQDIIRHLARS